MTKVIDIINQKKAPFASFELVPPLKGSDINKLYGAIEPLMEFALPSSISPFTGMKWNSAKRPTVPLKK